MLPEFRARTFITSIPRRAARDDGQALVEYALIVAMVAIVSIVVMQVVGLQVADLFTDISNGFN